MIGVVGVDSFPTAPSLGDCFFHDGVEGDLAVTPVCEVDKFHFPYESRDSRDDKRMKSFTRYGGGHKYPVGIETHNEAGAQGGLGHVFEEAIVTHEQRDDAEVLL